MFTDLLIELLNNFLLFTGETILNFSYGTFLLNAEFKCLNLNN